MRDGSGWRGAPFALRCLVALVVAASFWLSPRPGLAQADAPLTLTLRGDETPEAVRKLVDTLSAGGRKVEIRLAGPGAPATSSPATSLAVARQNEPIAPPAMSGSRLEMIWDNFVARERFHGERFMFIP